MLRRAMDNTPPCAIYTTRYRRAYAMLTRTASGRMCFRNDDEHDDDDDVKRLHRYGEGSLRRSDMPNL